MVALALGGVLAIATGGMTLLKGRRWAPLGIPALGSVLFGLHRTAVAGGIKKECINANEEERNQITIPILRETRDIIAAWIESFADRLPEIEEKGEISTIEVMGHVIKSKKARPLRSTERENWNDLWREARPQWAQSTPHKKLLALGDVDCNLPSHVAGLKLQVRSRFFADPDQHTLDQLGIAFVPGNEWGYRRIAADL